MIAGLELLLFDGYPSEVVQRARRSERLADNLDWGSVGVFRLLSSWLRTSILRPPADPDMLNKTIGIF